MINITSIHPNEEEKIIERYNAWQEKSLNNNNLPRIGLYITPIPAFKLQWPVAYLQIYMFKHILINLRYSHQKEASIYVAYPVMQKIFSQIYDKFHFIGCSIRLGIGGTVYLPLTQIDAVTFQSYLGGELNLYINIPISYIRHNYPRIATALAIKIEFCNSQFNRFNISIGMQAIENQLL